jgi:uncharacterized protein YheU (UPF0270 family)
MAYTGRLSSRADETPQRVEVPHAQLSPAVLRRLLEEFVTRDGTDYGPVERTLEEKVARLVRQLEAGEAAIVVDLESEAVNIIPRPLAGRLARSASAPEA